MDLKVIKQIVTAGAILAVIALVAAILLGQNALFVAGIAVGAVSAIGLFYAHSLFQKKYMDRVKDGEELRLSAVMASSLIKLAVLMGILILAVVVFHLDALGLLIGVTAHYFPLMLVPLFARKNPEKQSPSSNASV